MAEFYLSKQFYSVQAKAKLVPDLSTFLSSIPPKILSKFKRPLPPSSFLQPLIDKHLSKLNAADVDLNLRRAKLREAKRLKLMLEGKLQHLADSINTLNAIDDASTKLKPNLKESKQRKEYFAGERAKSKQIEIKSHEYYIQQKQRQEKIKKHLLEIEEEIRKEKELKSEQIKKQKEERDREYKKMLKDMKRKANQRKKEIELQKSYDEGLKKIRGEKPLYLKISEKYVNEVEMPELEKRKAEISKKRLIGSISSQQLNEHAKWYDTLRFEHKKKHKLDVQSLSIDAKAGLSDSTLTVWKQRLIDETKLQRLQKIKEHEKLLQKLDKRANYSHLVKEMNLTTVDEELRKEIEKRKEKQTLSTKLLSKTPNEGIQEKKFDWKPHKFKPNPLIPKAEPRKVGQSVDYLGERRAIREKVEHEIREKGGDPELVQFEWDEGLDQLTDNKRIEILKEKTRKFERMIRKKELALSGPLMTVQNLQVSDNINEMILKSIKTKLAMIEKTKDDKAN
jgi:hypothetical protein